MEILALTQKYRIKRESCASKTVPFDNAEGLTVFAVFFRCIYVKNCSSDKIIRDVTHIVSSSCVVGTPKTGISDKQALHTLSVAKRYVHLCAASSTQEKVILDIQ